MKTITITSEFDEQKFIETAIYSLEEDGETLNGGHFLATAPEKWIKEKHTIFVATMNGAIVGYVVGYASGYHPDFIGYCFHQLWVSYDFRKRGIGRRFSEVIIDDAKEENCTRVTGWCHSKNIDFFKKLGFTVDVKPASKMPQFYMDI